MRIGNGKDRKHGNDGGPSDLISFGSKGWVGVLTGSPGYSSNAIQPGIVQLPASGQEAYNSENFPVRVLISASEGYSYGWVKLAHVGGTGVGEAGDRFLLGYAEFDETQSKG